MRRSLLLVFVGFALTASATAQTPGSCTIGRAQGDLATPDLFARVFNTGNLFYGNTTTSGDGYFVPRSRRLSLAFNSGLWVGGRVGGEVRTAAARYDDFNFWPGPLDPGATLPNPNDCSAFDRIFVVSPADVAAYDATGSASSDLAAWPVGLGAPAVGASGQPVAITSRTQTLNLAAGERPALRGGPTAFWVMNDVGNARSRAGEQPLGIEVQVTAFAPSTSVLTLRQATVYRYTVINRNSVLIDDLRMGLFMDPDLGAFNDDFIGTDSTRGMGYAYNGSETDAQYGIPPALGVDIFSGAGASTYFQGVVSNAVGDPDTAPEYYNQLSGLWNDGTPFRQLSDGYNQPLSVPTTRFVFPADPLSGQPWSEVNPGPGLAPNTPADRRFVTSARAVTLAPGASTTMDIGLLFAQGASRLESVAQLRRASDLAQAAYDAGSLFAGTTALGTVTAPALSEPADGASFNESPVTLRWTPAAGADGYILELSPSPEFAGAEAFATAGTEITLPSRQFPPNRTAPFYWRVRSTSGTTEGPPGQARSFTTYRYVAGLVPLASGAPAIVETTAPGGGPACDATSTDEGCLEVGGDLVFNDPNSTGDYSIVSVDEARLGGAAPNDFEVRFTAQGSIAIGPGASVSRLSRVPIEIWDVGPTTPGQPNDPADDRQLIVLVAGGACQLEYDTTAQTGNPPRTRPIVAYGATTTYADFEAVAGPLVAAAPDGCPTGEAVAAVAPQINRGVRPITSLAFQQTGARAFSDLTGATVRFYTADQIVSSEDGTEALGVSALRAAFPNPVRVSLTVPYTTASAGTVRLRLVDVLGRTVAVLADGPQAAGDHQARFDVRALASGVYAVVLEAGDVRSTRTVTVVR